MRTSISKAIPLLVFIAAWQLYMILDPSSEFFVGSPGGVLVAIGELHGQGVLVESFLITLSEVVLGYSLALIVGNVIGISLWTIPRVSKTIHMYLLALSSVPLFALAPIFIFSLGTGFIAKVVIVFFSSVFLVIFQSFTGAKAVESEYRELMLSLNASQWQFVKYTILPGAAVWVVAGSKISIGGAIIGAFIAELISSSSGLGYIYLVAEGLFNVNQIWVAILGYITISFIVSYSTLPIERLATRYKQLH